MLGLSRGRSQPSKSQPPEPKYAPHVIQPSPLLPLIRPLHNLHALHIRTKHLHPHLNPNPSKRIAQQTRRVNTSQSDTHTHPGKRIPVLERHPDDIADFDAAAVSAVVEERAPFAAGIEGCQLGL